MPHPAAPEASHTALLPQRPVCSLFMTSEHSGCRPEEDFYNARNPGLAVADGECDSFSVARGVVSGLHRTPGPKRQQTITRSEALRSYNTPYGGIHGWKQARRPRAPPLGLSLLTTG